MQLSPRRIRAGRASVLAVALAMHLASAPAASAEDTVVTSADGTKIVTSFFTADGLGAGEKAPTVLLGPGWSVPRGSDSGSSNESAIEAAFGTVSVRQLRAAGYNVVTWDPRGFGQSGGTVTADYAENEGRDVQAILDYVTTRPEVVLESPDDPLAGMAGPSYGGGIQLVTAGIDDRIDAIVPVIAWHSLHSSFYRGQVIKSGWGSILVAAGVNGSTIPGLAPGPAGMQTGHLDPHIYDAFVDGGATGRMSDENQEWFRSRGPGELVERIRVPTLLIQGTVDTLFTLDEAITNYGILRRNGVPTKMLWFCGGHGACLTNPGDQTRTKRATIAWLDRYLKGDTSIDTGPRFEWIDQNGTDFSAVDYPLAGAGTLAGEDSGPLALEPGASSGGAVAATRAAGAFEVELERPGGEVHVVGSPRVELTYQGVAAPADARVFAQLVDGATGIVLGNQVTPIPIMLDGKEHTTSVNLETVAATVTPDAPIILQLAPGSSVYDFQRSAGAVDFSRVRVEVPVVDPAATVAFDSAAASMRIVKVRGARRARRRMVVSVRGPQGVPVWRVHATVRTARGKLVGHARRRGLRDTRRVGVPLRRSLRPGLYRVAVLAERGNRRIKTTRRVRVRR